MVRTEGTLTTSVMYAGEQIINIPATNGEWQSLDSTEVEVKGGRIEVGFRAEGEAGARLLVDDVEMKKKQ